MKKHLRNLENKKILMVGPYPPPYGGIAIVVRDLLDSPLKEKFDLKLLKTQPIGGNEVKRFFSDIKNLIKKLINFKPDIVHIHTSYDWGWPKNITYALIAKMFGKKIILHIHSYDKRCNNFFPKKWLKRYIYPPSPGLKIADYVFTLSDEYSRNIKNVFKNIKVQTIRNGVLNSRFNKIQESNVKNGLFITNISLSKRKGIIEIMQVAPKIIEKYPNIKFFIVGFGDYSEKVKRWHEQLNNPIKNNVILTGIVTEEEKIRILQQSDIFILQSDNEGLPIAILEAMSTGCSIITTPVGRIKEVVKDGFNGFLISPRDSKELFNSVSNLIENQDLLIKIKENNKKESLKYSWEEISKEIEETYNFLSKA